MKRKYANVGEKVKLLNDLMFVRVGYPLCSEEIYLRDNLRKRKYELMNAAAKAMFPKAKPNYIASLSLIGVERDDDTLHLNIDYRISYKLAAAATMAVLIENGFGGKERKVYENPDSGLSAMIGNMLEVTGKRFVKTGTRYNGGGGYSYEGEYDYEPAGLSDMETHCIYTLDGWIQTLAKNTERKPLQEKRNGSY